MRSKQVAKDGALSALAASKPGPKGRERDYEFERAKAEVARLSEACNRRTRPRSWTSSPTSSSPD